MKLSGYVRVPNWIDDDHLMYDSTKRVLAALLACAGSRMTALKSQEELAAMAGCCRNTVIKAVRELTDRGILFTTRRYRYSKRLGKTVRGKTRYHIRRCDRGSYTLLPRELLPAGLTPAEFAMALHTYRLAGGKGRCFPSLGLFAGQTDHARSTVCRCMKKLHLRQIISRLRCRKQNRAYACTSYYPIAWVRKGPARSLSPNGGSLIFAQLPVINKITRGFYSEGKEKGVGQFGNLYNSKAPNSPFDQFFFDGTGVRVSAGEERELIG